MLNTILGDFIQALSPVVVKAYDIPCSEGGLIRLTTINHLFFKLCVYFSLICLCIFVLNYVESGQILNY